MIGELPGGATSAGMIPDSADEAGSVRLLPLSVMEPTVLWLFSAQAWGVWGERIAAAADFDC